MSEKISPVYKETYVKMPDGTSLYTRVIFPREPSEGETFPVIFHRTPYEPDARKIPFSFDIGLKPPVGGFVEAGYVFVNQHCRGTGSSEGVFRNMKDEQSDGMNTLNWLYEQPWYGGELFLYGVSYKAYIQSSILTARPRDLRGAILNVMPANQYYVCYEGHTFKHDLYTMWFTRLYHKNQLNWKEKFAQVKEELKVRPLSALPERLYGHPVPELTDPFNNDSPDADLWQSGEGFGDSTHAPEIIDVPLLIIGGYYDIHYCGTLDYWKRLNDRARAMSAMIVGPWGHEHDITDDKRDLFPNAERGCAEIEWFENIRHGTPLTKSTKGKITYYRKGDEWHTADFLGSNSNSTLDLFPAPDGQLNTIPADGEVSYIYDPKDPAHFPGGSNVFQSADPGLQPQPEPNFRPDVKSFITPPFTAPAALDGGIEVELEVSSDCPDTAFFVRADIVCEDTAWYLRDTIVSLSETVKDYRPGDRVKIKLHLDPIAWIVAPGDRLRIDISSSNFPTYNAHANTRVYWADAVRCRRATNTVYLSGSKISFATQK